MEATAVQLASLIVITMVQVLGLFLNGCIVFFNFIRLKNKPIIIINASSLIYFAMGLANAFLQFLFMVQNFLSVCWPHLFFTRKVGLSIYVCCLIFMHCSFWLTAWLCAHYCVTIGNTTHRFIIVLRRTLSSFLTRILLLTAVGSVFISIPGIWMMDMALQMQPQINSTLETSIAVVTFHIYPAYMGMAVLLGSCLPFTLAVVSTGVTTSTLIGHITKMKHNVSGYNQPSIQSLINATRTMILFLTCSVIFYAFELVFLYQKKKNSSDFVTLTGWLVVMSFPSAEALIIIQAIPKLRKTILQKLCFGQASND